MSEDGALTWFLISGAPRSGTTLMQNIINSHPSIVCTHEYNISTLLDIIDRYFYQEDKQNSTDRALGIKRNEPNGSLAPIHEVRTLEQFDLARVERVKTINRDAFPIPRRARDEDAFLHNFFQIISGKDKLVAVGDKTPNIYDATAVQDLRVRLGGMKVITIVRNPIDVVASSMRRVRMTEAGNDDWHARSIHDAIIEWMNNWEHLARDFLVSSPDDLFIRYEDLATDFHGEMERVAAFLGVANAFENVYEQIPDTLRDFRLSDAETREVETRLGILATGWLSTSLSEHLSRTPNVIATVKNGQVIRGNDADTSRYILRKGFGQTEDWGTWTHGTHAQVSFHVSGVRADAKIWIEMVYIAWTGGNAEFEFAIKPKSGDVHVIKAVFAPGRAHAKSGFVCSARRGTVEFEIFIPRPKQAYEEPVAENRSLGIGIVSITPIVI